MCDFLCDIEMSDVPPSSPSTDAAKIRACVMCKSRMSSLQNDKHSLCVSCRGGDCSEGNKCNECLPWSEEEFARYLRHRKTLDVKAKSKSKMAKLKVKGKSESGNSSDSNVSNVSLSEGKPTPSQSVSGNKGEGIAKETGDSLSRSEIVALISQSVGSFSELFRSEVANAMTGAFKEISSTLDRRLGPEEEFIDEENATNPFISESPSLAPVQQSLGKGRSDPPSLTPTQGTCDSWGEQIGSERESMPSNPLTVKCFLESLAGQGVNISRDILVAAESWGSQAGTVGNQGVSADVGDRSRSLQETSPGIGTLGNQLSGASGVPRFVAAGSRDTSLPSRVGDSLGTRKSVSFAAVTPLDEVEESDDPLANSSASAAAEKRFLDILSLVFDHHSEELSAPESKAPKVCGFENLFKVSSKEEKRDLYLSMYHRVKEVLGDVREKFIPILENAKPLVQGLGSRKKKYQMSDFPSWGSAPQVNPNLSRIMANVHGKRSCNLTYDESMRVENVTRGQLEVQNHSFWLLSTLLSIVKDGGFVPPDPVRFENLVSELSLSLVNSTRASAAVTTFLQAKRRESLLAHLPCHVAACHKSNLLKSSFEGEFLFESEALDKVIGDVQQDSNTEAQLAISKAVSFPSFSSFRSAKKVDPQPVERNQASTSFGRGRGRGGRGGFQGFKRKESPASLPAPKSPRRGGRSPRGRGFTK